MCLPTIKKLEGVGGTDSGAGGVDIITPKKYEQEVGGTG